MGKLKVFLSPLLIIILSLGGVVLPCCSSFSIDSPADFSANNGAMNHTWVPGEEKQNELPPCHQSTAPDNTHKKQNTSSDCCGCNMVISPIAGINDSPLNLAFKTEFSACLQLPLVQFVSEVSENPQDLNLFSMEGDPPPLYLLHQVFLL